jgi:hypothetical protein
MIAATMAEDPPSRLPALLAIIFIVALVTGGFYLSRYLAGVSRTEDCMMAGRRACGEVIRGG